MTELRRFDRTNNAVDESYQLLAARYLRNQTKRLVTQFDGIRQSVNIEFVHRGRVASRRLRTGLRMFADLAGTEQTKRWRKQIRRLADNLSEARDRDVQIEFLTTMLSDLEEPDCYPGIVTVLARLQNRRQRLQPMVVAALDRFESAGTAKAVLAMSKSRLSNLDSSGMAVSSSYVLARSEALIGTQLKTFLSHQEYLDDPANGARHHRMRIAAKRLRYTMEICGPAHQGRLDPFIDAVKKLQTILGDIHDCDAWNAYLGKVLKRQRKNTLACYGHLAPLERLQIGIDLLQRRRVEARRLLFSDLLQYWNVLEEEKTWQELARTISVVKSHSGRLSTQIR
jgi:CHAD domain-containing protein